ncbi:CD209 antigen-like protein B isoform X2 [Xenopus laevis]|uniref:CD209 antigen-like protein B isoform X2 n=1 Tax=Xenopus laevis TaxID=8355 RepID=A0A8J0UND9_XENLA|nr:CD209 antigen-like protein B isoform X2 [Xenopus laevis]
MQDCTLSEEKQTATWLNFYENKLELGCNLQPDNEDDYADVDVRSLPPIPDRHIQEHATIATCCGKWSSRRWLIPTLILLVGFMFLLWIILIAVTATFYAAISGQMLELKQNKMETKKEYSSQLLELKQNITEMRKEANSENNAISSQILELKQNIMDTKKEVLSEMLNAPVKMMEERLMAEITKLKEDIRSLRKCPESWMLIESKCYYISTTALTWEESKNDCIRRNSNLLILRDKKEMDDLQPSLRDKALWIGMSKIGYVWLWTDLSIPSFTQWAPNEPNNAGSQENCVEIKAGAWNDVNCSIKKHYICN